MRAGPLSNKEIIGKLNRFFVPVFVSNEDYEDGGAAPSAERGERDRIWREAQANGLSSGSVHAYILAPSDGAVNDSLHVARAAEVEETGAMLERAMVRFSPEGGEALAPLRLQAGIPAVEPGGLALHLTARYLSPDEGNDLEIELDPGLGTSRNGSWSAFPAENWIVWSEDDVQAFSSAADRGLDQAGRRSWPPAIAERLLVHCYPSTECNDAGRNRIESAELWTEAAGQHGEATLIRLGGRLRMRKVFYPGREDDNRVEAEFTGYAKIGPEDGRIQTLRLVSRSATYAGRRFGVAVESTGASGK
ncbi:MAG TPA: hypothetical protein VMN36_00335 [Verrucomicrobiales bacterium]|nr:hypothetical protein [Verrucomicrobiales bacterium]